MTKTHPKTALEHILKTGICPIVLDLEMLRIIAKNTKEIGPILSGCGIHAIEVADREPGMLDLLERVIIELDAYRIRVGVGTVTSIPQAEKARRMGAQFVVGPNFSEAVSYYCKAYPGFPYVPSAATSTEITTAYERGWETVKFFPGSDPHALMQIRGALARELPHLSIIASGIEKPKDKDLYDIVRPWYEAKANALVYGSQIFDKTILANNDWKQFAIEVKQFVSVVSHARSRRH